MLTPGFVAVLVVTTATIFWERLVSTRRRLSGGPDDTRWHFGPGARESLGRHLSEGLDADPAPPGPPPPGQPPGPRNQLQPGELRLLKPLPPEGFSLRRWVNSLLHPRPEEPAPVDTTSIMKVHPEPGSLTGPHLVSESDDYTHADGASRQTVLRDALADLEDRLATIEPRTLEPGLDGEPHLVSSIEQFETTLRGREADLRIVGQEIAALGRGEPAHDPGAMPSQEDEDHLDQTVALSPGQVMRALAPSQEGDTTTPTVTSAPGQAEAHGLGAQLGEAERGFATLSAQLSHAENHHEELVAIERELDSLGRNLAASRRPRSIGESVPPAGEGATAPDEAKADHPELESLPQTMADLAGEKAKIQAEMGRLGQTIESLRNEKASTEELVATLRGRLQAAEHQHAVELRQATEQLQQSEQVHIAALLAETERQHLAERLEASERLRAAQELQDNERNRITALLEETERRHLAERLEATERLRAAELLVSKLRHEPSPEQTAEIAELRRQVAVLASRGQDNEAAWLAAEASSRQASDALREVEERVVASTREKMAAQRAAHEEQQAMVERRLANLATERENARQDAATARTRAQDAIAAAEQRARAEVDHIRAEWAQEMAELLTGVDQLRNELEAAQAQMSQELQTQAASLGQLNAELAEREAELERAVTTERTLAHDLGQLRAEAAAERTRAQRALGERQEQLSALTREREAVSLAVTEKAALLGEAEAKLAASAEAVRRLETQLARTQALAKERVQELKRSLAERDTELSQIRGELEARLNELGEAKAHGLGREQKLRDLEDRLSALTRERDARERDYVAARSRLETTLAEARGQVEDRDRRVLFLQEQVEKSEKDALDLEDRVQAAARKLEARTKEFRDAYARKEDEARKATEAFNVKTQEAGRLSHELRERDRALAAESSRLESKVKEKDTQVNELLRLLESRTDAIKAAEAARGQALDAGRGLEHKLRAAEERHRELGRELERERERAAEAVTLRKELDGARLAHTRLRATTGELERATARNLELEALLSELETARAEREQARTEREQARTEREQARAEREQARAVALELERANRRVDQLEATIEELEATRAAELTDMPPPISPSELAEARELVSSLRTEVGERDGRIRELDQLASARMAEAEAARAAENEARQRIASIFETSRAHPIDTAGDTLAMETMPFTAVATAAEPGPDLVRTAAWRWPVVLGIAALLALGVVGGGVLERARQPRLPPRAAEVGPTAATTSLPAASPAEAGRAASLVRAWARHIELREWKNLLALYEPGFHPPEFDSRRSFEAAVLELLRTAEWLAVDSDRIDVRRAADGRLLASFPFELRARGHLDLGRKELMLAAGPKGDLRIRAERWAAPLP